MATPECTVITVAGEIDIAAKEQFFSVLSENLAPGEALVLDLAEVTFLDSGGLWALLKAAKHATATGAEMLVVASPAVSRTLALTQTSHFLALHHDRASAVQAGAVHDRPQQDE
ncbi:MAG TPA: STAS domain-containing protein [Actinocrinis sp.]|nr:STAS domain-containing protein [Actinocrinis sp.]